MSANRKSTSLFSNKIMANLCWFYKVMTVAPITLRRMPLEAIVPFLDVTKELKVNMMKDEILSKPVSNIGCKVLCRPEILFLIVHADEI